MQTILKITIILLVFFSTTSCEKEFKLDLEETDIKMVVNSLVNAQEPMSVTVTKSIAPNTEAVIEELVDAEVSIYKNEEFLEKLVYSKTDNDIIGKFTSSFIPEVDADYRIEVEQSDFGIAKSLARVPNGVDISDATVKYIGDGKYNFSFNLDDPDEENFYYLKMYFRGYKTDSVTQERIYVEEQRVELPEGIAPELQRYLGNGYIFKDESFLGNNITLAGVARFAPTVLPFGEFKESFPRDSTTLHIHLETLSEEAYKYYSSHSLIITTEFDIFSETATIYGNVENGLGIFAGIYVSDVGVEVED